MNKARRHLRLTQLHREELRESLLKFTLYTKRDYRANWHHERLAEKLDLVAQRRCRRLMVFLPPQHGKSELVSRRFPAFMLGRDPDLRLIACSHTHSMAVSLNANVQRIMSGNAYGRVFPESKLTRSPRPYAGEGQGVRGFGTRASTRVRRTLDLFEIPGRRGSLRSAGVGNSIAGNAADGAIIDDPFGKREDADSPVIREKIWQWYTNDLYSRLSTEAWIVLTHTRWHRDDLAGRLLRKMADAAGDQWEVLCLPAVRGDGPGDPCDGRTPGQVLWPEFKSAADLEIIRRQDPRAYAALYQQDPSEASNSEWAAELFGDWIWVPPEKWPKKFDLRVVCVDASKGAKDGLGDYAAIVFLGGCADTGGLLYVDALLDRIPLDQIVRRTIVFCDEHRAEMVGFEAEQFQELLVHEFNRQCGQGVRWPVYEMTCQGVPKVARIRRLSQYVINRELRFKADSPGCRLLVEQLMDFPLADHDDGPDALEMCVRLILSLYQPPE